MVCRNGGSIIGDVCAYNAGSVDSREKICGRLYNIWSCEWRKKMYNINLSTFMRNCVSRETCAYNYSCWIE